MSDEILAKSFFPNSNLDPLDFMFKIAPITAEFAFMTITETGLKKSIMDATGSVRMFLKSAQIHNYESQAQGPEHKIIIKSFFIKETAIVETKASLYRPVTKKGDPRIWFSGLNSYAHPKDLLLLFSVEKTICVANLSLKGVWDSFLNHGNLFNLLIKSKETQIKIRDELLEKIKAINKKGWIKATTTGDTAVGDTLENELGIVRNNLPNPDYKGIELKASRSSINNKKKAKTRITLFAKVPDHGLTYHEILAKFGKIQTPKGSTESRLQLYETFKATKVNAYDLFLKVNESQGRLEIQYSKEHSINSNSNEYVSSWTLENLANTLKEKHKETFFVSAQSKFLDGVEYFYYDKIIHTHNPNTSVLPALFEDGTISLDLLVHISNGKYRDHGSLFKIFPASISLLFGEPEIIDLN